MEDKLGRNRRLVLENNGDSICHFDVTPDQADLVSDVGKGIISHRGAESNGRVIFEYACERRSDLQELLDKVQDR